MRLIDLAPTLDVKISGCPNGCGQHHIAAVGFQGSLRKVDGRAVPQYFVMVGGGVDGRRRDVRPARREDSRAPRATWRSIGSRVSMPREQREDESAAAFFNRVDVVTVKKLLADLEPLTAETATTEDFIDLAEIDRVRAGDDRRGVRGLGRAEGKGQRAEGRNGPPSRRRESSHHDRGCSRPPGWSCGRAGWSPLLPASTELSSFRRVIVWKSWRSLTTSRRPNASCVCADWNRRERLRLYAHAGRSALLHLARVAAGLDSLIVGEAEISGQIRRAVAAGRGAGLVGPVLERVTSGVLRASGRARSETRIGQGTISAATAAVSLLEREWGSLEGRSVLVVGAGEAGRQTLGRLRKRRASRLLVASRSAHHAVQAAGKTAATVVPLDALAAVLDTVDASSPRRVRTGFSSMREICRSAARSRRTLEIVDLSVPRVVDPAVAELAGVSLHTVDDLGEVVRDSVRRREREIPAVERIVADEAERTYQQFLQRRDRRRTAVA